VERATFVDMSDFIRTNWFGFYIWLKVYNGVDTATVDCKVHRILSFLCNFSIDDLVLSIRIALYGENNNLFAIGIYNSYGSDVHEIITRNYLL